MRNVFFDNFDYQKLWKTTALMVCFNSFNFCRQVRRIFIVSLSSLIWLKKIAVLLFISSLLILIDSFKKFWRFVKRNLLKIVIAPPPGYFIVLMQISYNHFYVTNCTNTLCCVDVLVFIFLLSFNLLRKQKNDPCLKIILTSIAFLVSIIYRFSKPHNR